MTESTDHAARAREIARDALKFVQKTMDPERAPVSYADAGLIFDTAQTQMAAAQVEATLAVAAAQDRTVAAQDRANELKRIEILTRFAHVDPRAAREVWARVGDDQEVFAPSIAASLGLGGESDGE